MNMWQMYSACDYQVLLTEGFQGILFSILLLLLSLLLLFRGMLVLTHGKQFIEWVFSAKRAQVTSCRDLDFLVT